MKTIVWFIIGVAVGCLGSFAYRKYGTNGTKRNLKRLIKDALDSNVKITTDECDILKMEQVISYFRSLNLTQGQDIPFVVKANCLQGSTHTNIPEGTYNIGLGVFNVKSVELSSLKVVIAQSWADDFAEKMGKESLLVIK